MSTAFYIRRPRGNKNDLYVLGKTSEDGSGVLAHQRADSRHSPPVVGAYQDALAAPDAGLEFTKEAVDLVGAEGFDPEFGARPLRRTIQRKVDNELSRMLLEGSLNPGDLGRGS